MTVRVSPKTRKRIDAMKKELVTDHSYKDIHKKGFIYESPDGGNTIYRRPTSYCDVSGVKIDKPDQLEFEFDEFKADPQYQAGYSDAMAFVEDMGEKISQVATLLGEVTEGINKLRDNN